MIPAPYLFKTNFFQQHHKAPMKIAIVGLTPADTLIIKSFFLKLVTHAEIEWLGLDTAQADALIFRAKFFHTPTIESWIKVAPKDVAIGAVYRDAANSGACREAGVHLLDLTNRDQEVLKAWLELIIQKKANAVQVRQAITREENAALAASTLGVQKAQAGSSSTVRPHSEPIDQAFQTPDQFPNAAILQSIRNGAGMLASNSGYLAYLQPQDNKVWANHPQDTIPPFDACQWQLLSGAIPAEMKIVVDLRQWLWESLWNSTIDFASYIKADSSYQLKVWPQPRGMANRTIPLRIAALLQKGPASISSLAQLTQIPDERIKKLLYTMQLVDFVQVVQASQAQQSAEQDRLAQPVKDEKKMGIFKRIREKFNLFSA